VATGRLLAFHFHGARGSLRLRDFMLPVRSIRPSQIFEITCATPRVPRRRRVRASAKRRTLPPYKGLSGAKRTCDSLPDAGRTAR
jgi:hypothetical protein